MDEREKSLPKWAQELIKNLRQTIKINGEPLVREIAKLRPLNEYLKARNEAYQELLDCAAKGGHPAAQTIVEVIEQYDIPRKVVQE